MASETMLYQLERLDDISAKMGNTVNTLRTIEESFQSIENIIDPVWSGKTKDCFIGGCAKIRKDVSELMNEIGKNKTSLEKAVQIYRTNEGVVKNTVDDLSTHNIF